MIRMSKSKKETPQKLTQLSSRSHPRHLVGKRTAQKDTIIDITSDSQVNSNLPHRWSPASLTFNNYFYLFLYLYITWITINNNAPHLKSPKNQNRRAALGRPAIKITGGLELVCGRPTLARASVLVYQIQHIRTRKLKRIKHKRKAKRAAGIEGQVATMLELHTRQADTVDITALKRARKNEKSIFQSSVKLNNDSTMRSSPYIGSCWQVSVYCHPCAVLVSRSSW